MRLEPLYRATFTTPEHWTTALRGESGVESQSFLIAEGRTEGRLSARLRGANFPRRRTDGTLTPDFRGVLETDDGAVVLFSWRGFVRDGRLTGSVTHLSDNPRYSWLNDRVCAVAGNVGRREGGFEVALEVAELLSEE
jgi:hypothetical protein